MLTADHFHPMGTTEHNENGYSSFRDRLKSVQMTALRRQSPSKQNISRDHLEWWKWPAEHSVSTQQLWCSVRLQSVCYLQSGPWEKKHTARNELNGLISWVFNSIISFRFHTCSLAPPLTITNTLLAAILAERTAFMFKHMQLFNFI